MFVQRCNGCGRLAVDAEQDLINMRDEGKLFCCPEREIETVEVHGGKPNVLATVLLRQFQALPDNVDDQGHIEYLGNHVIKADGIFDLDVLAHLMLEDVIHPIGDDKHWEKLAEERYNVANQYLMRAREAEAKYKALVDKYRNLHMVLDEYVGSPCMQIRFKQFQEDAKEALSLCERTFREYAEMHLVKGPGHEAKVERNLNMATKCAEAIKDL